MKNTLYIIACICINSVSGMNYQAPIERDIRFSQPEYFTGFNNNGLLQRDFCYRLAYMFHPHYYQYKREEYQRFLQFQQYQHFQQQRQQQGQYNNQQGLYPLYLHLGAQSTMQHQYYPPANHYNYQENVSQTQYCEYSCAVEMLSIEQNEWDKFIDFDDDSFQLNNSTPVEQSETVKKEEFKYFQTIPRIMHIWGIWKGALPSEMPPLEELKEGISGIWSANDVFISAVASDNRENLLGDKDVQANKEKTPYAQIAAANALLKK